MFLINPTEVNVKPVLNFAPSASVCVLALALAGMCSSAAANVTSKGPLLQTAWTQHAPFNLLCPSITQNGSTYSTVAGCSPLATAQVLNFHKWPTYGIGQHSYYWPGSGTSEGCAVPIPGQVLTANFGDAYDWASMPSSCPTSTGCGLAERDAVSELCYEVGVAQNQVYGCNSSFTAPTIPLNLRYHSQAIRTLSRSNYATSAWFDLIKAEIDANRPILYTMTVSLEGLEIGNHCLVLDGWKIDDGTLPALKYVHLVFGWTPNPYQQYDGWYRIDAMPSLGDEGALMNIRPNYIYHVDVLDRENVGTSGYGIMARFEMPGALVSGTQKVYFSTSSNGAPFSAPVALNMSLTGNGLTEYAATIPYQSPGTSIRYYISTAVRPPNAGPGQPNVTYTYPLEIPGTQVQFNVIQDLTPPTIVHTQLGGMPAESWPPTVRATVTDNFGVSSVRVEWSVNGVPRTDVPLLFSLATHDYSAPLTGTVTPGDLISYRIRALDIAQAGNVAYAPSTGMYSFSINAPQVIFNFDNGLQGWSHAAVDPGNGWVDQWHVNPIAPARNGQSSGAVRFGNSDGSGDLPGYAPHGQGGLESPAFTLGNGASLSFWHRMHASQKTSPSYAGFDGGLIEISVNGGAWSILSPTPGYDLPKTGNGPFPNGTNFWTGNGTVHGNADWRSAQVGLSAYCGQSVRFRFRFGSDSTVESDGAAYDGWYLDDVVLTLGLSGCNGPQSVAFPVAPEAVLLRVDPNPFHNLAHVALTGVAPGESFTVDIIDISGRLVRKLHDGRLDSGSTSLDWNGRADDGTVAPSGIYFVMATGARGRTVQRLALVR